MCQETDLSQQGTHGGVLMPESNVLLQRSALKE